MIPLKSTTAGVLKVNNLVFTLLFLLYCGVVWWPGVRFYVFHSLTMMLFFFRKRALNKHLTRFCVFLDAAFCRRMC